MTKVVINKCHGGFGLSDEGESLYKQLTHTDEFYQWEAKRDDPALIQVIETLGEAANSRYAKLKIIEIPDNVEWQIEEYDGYEWVAEQHRTWR